MTFRRHAAKKRLLQRLRGASDTPSLAGSHPLIRVGTTISMMYGVGPYAKTTINKGVECVFEITNERKESGFEDKMGAEGIILLHQCVEVHVWMHSPLSFT